MAPLDLSGAFADRPREAATSFRAALRTLSSPGTVETLAHGAPPAPLQPAAGALLLVLADATTPLWLPERLRGSDAAGWLLFHTNAPQVADRAKAHFAVGRWDELLPLETWPMGDPQFPDRSATLIVELDALEGGAPLTLSGPGIPSHRDWAPALPPEAAAALRANAARSPLGVDFFFTAGRALCGLPRSTRIGG